MHTEAQSRIFSGICCGTLNLHLREGNLRCTFATQVLIGQARHMQITRCNSIKRMLRVRIQYIRLQQRVMCDAA